MILKIGSPYMEDIADVLEWVFLTFFPNFCLGEGLMNIYIIYGQVQMCEQMKAYSTGKFNSQDFELFSQWKFQIS